MAYFSGNPAYCHADRVFNLRGHIWRMKDEGRTAVHCAKCKQRLWDEEWQVKAELNALGHHSRLHAHAGVFGAAR
jgi:hypothetical protein